jgi:hypothetical protein
MPENDKKKTERTLNITVNRDAALVVGNEAPVTVYLGATKGSGSTINLNDLEQLDDLIAAVAQGRGVDASAIKFDLARALDAGDLPFVTKDNLPEALKILSTWKEEAISTPIGGKIRRQ